MTKINLLDWRAERRARRQKQFLALLGAVAVACALLVVIVDFVINEEVSHQRARNAFLQQQIAQLDAQIKEIQELERTRANLLERMRVIEQLQQSRSATVHFFDEVVNTMPDGVYLTSIKQQGQNVTLDGVAESNGRISSYMKNLEASPWFKDPKLVVIKTDDKSRLRNSVFTMQVTNLTKAADNTPSAPVAGTGAPHPAPAQPPGPASAGAPPSAAQGGARK
ncbi:MAG TPA: PilN domain-containing protein [Nevskia sp.]|jgi:type IV pilus assembly protein PilN|nr:PilN domain-containing protein [Nevskia sp.]